jgi:hypothetical protein
MWFSKGCVSQLLYFPEHNTHFSLHHINGHPKLLLSLFCATKKFWTRNSWSAVWYSVSSIFMLLPSPSLPYCFPPLFIPIPPPAKLSLLLLLLQSSPINILSFQASLSLPTLTQCLFKSIQLKVISPVHFASTQLCLSQSTY